mmetsp:Transcript_16592/g.27693  ORF Transcript_16592/g.27693 Transcript_16592/m.27693 type:complete len:349 (+) Transcript_16592:233-1279(+)
MDFQLYYVSCHENIPDTAWKNALETQLTASEVKSVTSYVFRKDQERSLLSLLLQKYVVRKFLTDLRTTSTSALAAQLVDQCNENSFQISRTRENKPFASLTSQPLLTLIRDAGCGFFNYNVSHHGSFVGIASHASLLIGVDIVDISSRASWVSGLTEFVEIYRKQLSEREMKLITDQSTERESYTLFYILWSLKEAYVKAIGVGIGIDLQQVEFDVIFDSTAKEPTSDDSCCQCLFRGSATFTLHGVVNDDWQFQFLSLDSVHIMTVARGPPSAALSSYAAAAWPHISPTQVPHDNFTIACSQSKAAITGSAKCDSIFDFDQGDRGNRALLCALPAPTQLTLEDIVIM